MCSSVSITELTSLKQICVPVDTNTNIEDVLIFVCKLLNIKPISRHLFGLRYEGGHWISLSTKLCDFNIKDFEFRIRFKVPDFKKLEDIDKQAFNYYFFQVRYDILCGRVKELSSDENKDKLLGLTVVDMYRFKLETGATTDDVLTDYKKFTPKEVINQHKFFIRKPIKEYLVKLENSVKRDLVNIKKIYLEQFEEMVPSYMDEVFCAKIDEGLQGDHDISILVCPYHQQFPGLLYCYTGKKEWKHLSTFEELCCISLHSDGKAEVSRKNGIPIYLRMNNNAMVSFITHLDGYYRLSVKWTFNLCKDFLTPSLQFLQSLKCHGPIGQDFSYKKLEQKRRNKMGCFILREHETSYDTYYIDVCDSNRKTVSYEISRKLISNVQCFWFSADNEVYPSIPAIITKYRSPLNELRFIECIPNSEYDISDLLLCRVESDDTKKANIQSPTELSTPLIIHPRNLRMINPAKIEGKFGITFVNKCHWSTKYVRMEVAVKCLKPNYQQRFLQEFLDLAGKWAMLCSSSVVRLLGVKLANGVAMVSEFFPHGSLDIYLEQNKSTLEEVDLVEAATYIASALLHMEAKGVVHGYLRCHKILVAAHTENCFIVRVSDPGIHVTFAEHDWHWIPPELYDNPEKVCRNTSADVWAFGTTLWQLFSFGENPLVPTNIKDYYRSGRRLLRPAKCSRELFKVLNECWHPDPDLRKQPQAAMRDINHFLYQVHNARRAHPYAATTKPIHRNRVDSLETLNDISSTALDEHSEIGHSQLTTSSFVEDSHSECHSLPSDSPLRPLIDKESDSAGFTQLYPSGLGNLVLSNDTTSIGSTTSVQSIMLNDLTIVIQGKIGKGFYGEVYKGFIEHTDNNADVQYVAVKKLITDRSSYMVDFEREIDIMKSLKHRNIVEMMGVIQDPEVSLIMEYVPHGSLKCYLITNKERLDCKNHLLRYASDVAEGMAYLGQKKIVHRDLAARNVLVADEFHVKISDFGLAQKTGQSDYYMLKTHRELPIRWYAPESLRHGRFSNSSEVWSYGVLLYEMFSFGEEPIITFEKSEDMSLLEILDSGVRLHCPEKCPQEVYRSLMMPCWQMDSKQRPTFLKIIEIINTTLTL